MANTIDEDEPLDPVMEKVRVKMVRLLGVSIGLMLLALITVLGAVVYKISQGTNEEVEASNSNLPSSEINTAPILDNIEVDLPEGARIISSNLSNGNVLFDLRMADGIRQLWIVNLQTGKVISRISLK